MSTAEDYGSLPSGSVPYILYSRDVQPPSIQIWALAPATGLSEYYQGTLGYLLAHTMSKLQERQHSMESFIGKGNPYSLSNPLQRSKLPVPINPAEMELSHEDRKGLWQISRGGNRLQLKLTGNVALSSLQPSDQRLYEYITKYDDPKSVHFATTSGNSLLAEILSGAADSPAFAELLCSATPGATSVKDEVSTVTVAVKGV